ncbi:hypothetical protein [Thalassospira marina]|uniref:hypothetical protein n=1 Tax=Thalassospira marina TaxID=2048283 RepID=UPI0010552984|nr:hypothetical protein [Thalassospira marina]
MTPGDVQTLKDELAKARLLSELFADAEIKAILLAQLKELGLRPPLHYLALRLITALVSRSESFIGKAITLRLQAFIDRTPKLADLLQKLINLQHGEKTKANLKNKLLGALQTGETIDLDTIAFDEATALEPLLAIHNIQGFQNILTAQENLKDELLAGFRKDLDNLFQDMVSPALGWPEESTTPEKLGAFDRVKYTSGLDELYGRGAEITLLHQFTGDLSLCGRLFNFRWMLMTGDGGTGKTRLAYDFTRKHLTPNIWDAGRLSVDDLPSFNDLEKWRPRQPTFIVIDYVSGHPEETGKLLRIFARKAAHYDFPVRLLLLERKADKSWLSKMLPENGDKPMVMNHVFGHEDENGRNIPPVNATAIADMMQERFAKAGQTSPYGDLLLAAAQRVDTKPNDANLPRPLFALATAEAMIAEAEKEPESQPDFTKIVALLNQEDVLTGMLRREEHTRWQPAAPNDGGGTLTRYKLALALATLKQGLDLNDLETKDADYGPLARHLPDPPPDHHQGLISALGGHGAFLPPLEPDIMGEFFLAETLLNDIPNHRHRFLNAALEKGHIEPLITLLRLQQDFPQKITDIDIPAAMNTCEDEKTAVSYARMAPDWVIRCYESNNPNAANKYISEIANFLIRFNQNKYIAQQEAKTAVNIIHYESQYCNWERSETMLQLIDTLRSQFSDNEEIAQQEANAALHISCAYIQSRELEHFKAIDRRLTALSDKNISADTIDNAFNPQATTLEGREWQIIQMMLKRIDDLRFQFSQNDRIATAEAITASNIALYATRWKEWKEVLSILRRFNTLRTQFRQNNKIVQTEAEITFTICITTAAMNKWPQVEAMLTRLDALRSDFSENNEIALLEAHAAVRISILAGKKGDWKRVDAMMARLDALRNQFNDNPEIALEEAKAAINISNHAGEKGDWERVDAMIARLTAIADTFRDELVLVERNGQTFTLGDAINYVTKMLDNKP